MAKQIASPKHSNPIQQTLASFANRSFFVRMWRRYRRARAKALARSATFTRFRLTREGFHLLLIVLFIFVGAVLRDINLLILIAAAMIGLVLLQWRFGIGTIVGLTASRKVPERVSQGAEVECVLTVANAKRWLGAWLVLIEDNITQVAPLPEKQVGHGATMIDELSPLSSGQGSYKIIFHRRGLYRFEPCTLSTRFPLNLGRSSRRLDVAQDVIVHPRLGELTSASRNLLHTGREGMTKTSAQAGVHATEFFGLRPWASGDSQRWIHWRTTARLGDLQVRQFERLRPQQAAVLLDLYVSPTGPSHEPMEAGEKAISFVATLASQAVRVAGNAIAVAIAANRPVSLPNIQSPVLVNNLLDELAVAAPTPNPDWSIAMNKMQAALRETPNLLVISTRPNASEDLRPIIAKSIGSTAARRLNITWLDVTHGDLEPYFTWTPIESKT